MSADKRSNFIRVAERRTNEILKIISTFSSFSNSNFYEYTSEDLEAISDAIHIALTEQLNFLALPNPKNYHFSLSDDPQSDEIEQ